MVILKLNAKYWIAWRNLIIQWFLFRNELKSQIGVHRDIALRDNKNGYVIALFRTYMMDVRVMTTLRFRVPHRFPGPTEVAPRHGVKPSLTPMDAWCCQNKVLYGSTELIVS
jgi:hypothetical protein